VVAKTKDIVGQVLNDTYRLTRKLDQGGMGAVYEAVHARLTRKRFAIKVLRPEASEEKELFTRFRREAEITSELGHPHIVNVIDFHETEDGRQYMVMEFLEGENLGNRLRRRGPLPPRELHRLMEQVGSGLQAAHDKGIVHRDMKPENIFLVDTGTDKPLAKVLDFGISKIRHSASVLTRDHSLLGSPFYMSPEQASGLVKTIDHYTDIFALGSICYHSLTGKLPFDGPTLQGVIYQVVNHQQEPLTKHNQKLDEAIDAVVTRAMAKKKEDRYPSVSEFVRALGRAVLGEEAAAEEPMDVKAIGLATTAVSVSTGPPEKKELDAKEAKLQALATGETALADSVDEVLDSAKGRAPDLTGPKPRLAETGAPPALGLSTYSSATGERAPEGGTLERTLAQSNRWPLVAGGAVVLLVAIIVVLIMRDPGTGGGRPAASPPAPPLVTMKNTKNMKKEPPLPAPRPGASVPAPPAPRVEQKPEVPVKAAPPDVGAATASKKTGRRPAARKKTAARPRKPVARPKPAPRPKVVKPMPLEPKPAPKPKAAARPKQPAAKPTPAAKPKPAPAKSAPKKPLGEDMMELPE